ncbi:ImpA family metalloprotease [Photobacterium damselae]
MILKKTLLSSLVLLSLSACHDSNNSQALNEIQKPSQEGSDTNKDTVTDVVVEKPIFKATNSIFGTTNQAIHGQISATDKKNLPLLYTMSGNPEWLHIDAQTGELSGTPGRNDNGDFVITVTASNGKATNTVKVKVNISDSNHVPQVVPVARQTIIINTSFSVPIIAKDSDDDTLTYRLINGPSWAKINPQTGVITGKGTILGQHPLNVQVSDGKAVSSVAVVMDIVVNPIPEIVTIGELKGTTRKAFVGKIVARDPNNKTLVYSMSGNPSWLQLDTATGVLSGTPKRDDSGEFFVTITVSNGKQKASSVIKLVISKSNIDPIIAPIASQIINAEEVFTYQVEAQDDDADTLSYTLQGAPSFISIDSSTGLITANPSNDDEGHYPFSVVVSDGLHSVSVSVDYSVQLDPVVKAIKHQDAKYATFEQYTSFIERKTQQAQQHNLAISNQITNGVGSFDWNPSHDSVILSTVNPNNAPILLGNSNTGSVPLAIASDLDGQRFIATSANITETENNRGFGDGNIASGELSKLAKNMLTWLAGKDVNNHINIIMLNTSNNNYWHETYNWFKRWLEKTYVSPKGEPEFSINAHGSCDGSKLKTCVEENKPDVVVMSSSDITDVNDYINNIKYLISHKIPILFVNSERDPSDALLQALRLKNISAITNYWQQWRVNNFDYRNQLQMLSSNDAGLQLIKDLNDGHVDISPAILDSCAKSGNYLLSCGGSEATPFLNTEAKKGIDYYRNLFKNLDESGINVFKDNSFDLYSAVLLAADLKRKAIDYPVVNSDIVNLASAMFADSAISYIRDKNAAQPDLGSFVKDRSEIRAGVKDSFAFPNTISEQKTFTVPFKNQWTTTGWFILPGKTVTLTRTDNDKNISVKLRMNIQLPNTNRGYQRGQLERPLELMQDRLTIKPGQTISFSSPYGGPLYVELGSSNKNENLSASFSISNVAHHPTITDFDDDNQIANFKQLLDSTELPYVDLKTDAAELHARKDRFLESINADYPTIKDLLDGIMTDHLESLYGLSGFTISQKPLNEQLPSYTAQICQNLFGADDCFDKGLNKRYLIQHEAYDQNAQCGVGCSGNPFTSFSGIYPSGWLVNHELGHNLQRYRLSVAYNEGGNLRNDWTHYGSRSGENSNNIFPYYAKWRAYYETNGKRGTITDGHMNQRDLFAVYMSDTLGLKDKSGSHRMVYDANCNPLDKDTSGDVTRFVGPWESNAYAIYNGYRMEFYIQAALRADKQIMSDGTRLDNGFGLFTLMYQHERIFSKYIASEELWNQHRDQLGFSLFSYRPDEAKGGTIDKISGNDFMLVSMSKITGKDWRPYFDMFGLYYSDLAGQQVIANGDTVKVEKGMFVLDEDLPNENMSTDLSWISFEGDISHLVWPRGNWSPQQCVSQ